jgi:hypothetical protein
VFGYRWDACEHWSFMATGVTPVSLRPLITVGKSRCVVMLRYCLGLGAFSMNKPVG